MKTLRLLFSFLIFALAAQAQSPTQRIDHLKVIDINGLTLTTGTGTLDLGSYTIHASGSGTLGSAAFTSAGAYEVPLTFGAGLTRTTNTITIGSGAISNSMLAGSIDLTTKVTGLLPDANIASAATWNAKLSANQTITLSGDASGSGTTAITVTIGAGKVTNAMLAGSIDLTTKVSGTLPVANGGTGTTTPALVAGTNITITGTWPNQTINASGGGGTSGDLLATLVNSEVSVTTTATLALSTMHVCSGTTANYTATLPAASGNAGKLVGVRMSSALTKLVTIKGNGSELIDGSNTRIMWAQESAILVCDGTAWSKIAGKTRAMSCSMGVSSDPSIPDNTWTRVFFDTAIGTPTPGMADTTNNRVSILRPGSYLFSSDMGYGSESAPFSVIAGIYGKSSTVIFTNWFGEQQISATGGFGVIQPVTKDDAVAGDYYTMWGYQVTGGARVMNTHRINVTEVPAW